MNVCFVSQAFVRYAGDPIGSFVYRLAEELAARDIRVTAVVPHTQGLPERETIGQTDVVRFAYAPASYERLAYQGNMHNLVRSGVLNKCLLVCFLVGCFARTVAAVRQQRSDVIHAHWWFPSGLAAAMASAVTGVPFVVTCHGTDVTLLGRHPVVDAVAGRVLGRAAAVTAVSHYLERNLVTVLPKLSGRVAITPMPVDRAFVQPPAQDRWSQGRRRILAVGRLSQQKGFDHLITALSILRQRGIEARVTFVGNGEEEAALKEQAIRLGVQDVTEFAGPKTAPELVRYLQHSDVSVLPSHEEGLGLTVIEAMFCGVPVVGSRAGGIADVIEDGRTGLLVTPGDATDLANALERVLTDPGLAQRLGAAGQAAVREKYDPDACVDSVVALYRQVARQGSGG